MRLGRQISFFLSQKRQENVYDQSVINLISQLGEKKNTFGVVSVINGLLYWYDLHSDIYYLDYGNISEREKGKKHIEYIYTYFFFFQ